MQNEPLYMDEDEIFTVVQYFVDKYLPADKAQYALDIFSDACTHPPKASAKDFLHILTADHAWSFEKDDLDLIKRLAHNLGV